MSSIGCLAEPSLPKTPWPTALLQALSVLADVLNEAVTALIYGRNLPLFKCKYARYSALLRKSVAVYTLPTLSKSGTYIRT